MALGEKLGKVFGAIGSGLSFVPGPWSAIGIGLSAAGGIASSVAQKKQEQEEPEPTSAPTEPPDASRPEQAQLQTDTSGYVSEPPKVSSPPKFSAQGHYQDRMQDEIASMIISDVPRGPYG